MPRENACAYHDHTKAKYPKDAQAIGRKHVYAGMMMTELCLGDVINYSVSPFRLSWLHRASFVIHINTTFMKKVSLFGKISSCY